jgi:hypothetical protein
MSTTQPVYNPALNQLLVAYFMNNDAQQDASKLQSIKEMLHFMHQQGVYDSIIHFHMAKLPMTLKTFGMTSPNIQQKLINVLHTLHTNMIFCISLADQMVRMCDGMLLEVKKTHLGGNMYNNIQTTFQNNPGQLNTPDFQPNKE